ncbi:MAG: hypothetical protein IPJ50_05015 [Betaproteobacteria bacterium]|nr:hypothetical protein [Betaproteobacteria bacterium]
METGRFQPATVVSMGKGAFKIGKTIIHDAFPEQTLSIEEIVVKSSNVGVAKVALQLPISEIKGIAKSLGIGESLGIYGLIGGVTRKTFLGMNGHPRCMHNRACTSKLT